MTAPSWNSVDVFRGEVEKRPSKFWPALSEADSLCRELDGLRELQTRVQELEDEKVELVRQVGEWNRCYGREVATLDAVRDENASLRCRVDELEDELVCARESLTVWRDRALAKAGASCPTS